MSTLKKEKNQPISVYVRVRPHNRTEIASNSVNTLQISGKELSVRSHASEKYQKNFVFDKIFGPNSKQVDVFSVVAQPAVAEIIAGYNCTVFAYGQTGTGKTYTMAGGSCTDSSESISSTHEETHMGIIPRTLAYLFDELRVLQLEYTVRVSYLELYNEEIFDLLSPAEDSTKLKLYDDSTKKGSVIVQGLTEVTVSSKSEVYKILESGAEKRRTAATLMNAQSSRSHTIFSITVHTKEYTVDGDDLLKTGKLNLVDLAGSENVNKSGVTDKRARETCSINTSLLTLGRCIVALAEHRVHIPYRESKLTRLLRDSLGGRTKTSLIATISPAFYNLEETLNTLEYASRAKHITNKPEMNQRLTKKALLKEYGDEIDRLRKDLQATRLCNGVYLANENYEDMLKELEIQKEEISEKINLIRALKEDMDNKEKLCNELQFKIQTQTEMYQQKEQELKHLESKLEEASAEISVLQVEKEEDKIVLAKKNENEQLLHTTAVKLLDVAELSTEDADKLHNKLDVIDELTKHNKQVCEQHINEFNAKISGLKEMINMHSNTQETFRGDIDQFINNLSSMLVQFGNLLQSLLNQIQDIQNEKISKELLHITQDCSSEMENYQKENENMKHLPLKYVEELKNKWVKILEPKIQKIYFDYKEINQLNQTMLSHFKHEITENISTAEKIIDTIKEDVEQRLDQITSNTNKLYFKYITSVVAEKECDKEIHQGLEEVIKTFQKIQNSVQKKNVISNSKNINTINKIMALQFQSTAMDERITSLTDKCYNTFNNVLEDVSSLEFQSIGDNPVQEVNDEFENISNSMSKMYINHSQTMSDIINEQFNLFHNYVLGRHSNLTAITEELDEYTKKHTIAEKTIVETFDPLHHGICTKLNQNRAQDVQYHSLFNVELDKTREEFKKLFTSQMKEYKPTGVTPIRRKYKFPKIVPPTTSREALLEEIRKTSYLNNSENREQFSEENDNKNYVIIEEDENKCPDEEKKTSIRTFIPIKEGKKRAYLVSNENENILPK